MKFCVQLTQLVALANAFQIQPKAMSTNRNTSLDMGFFDFKPIHGSGSGSSDSDLDEQFRLQQEIVRFVSLLDTLGNICV